MYYGFTVLSMVVGTILGYTGY